MHHSLLLARTLRLHTGSNQMSTAVHAVINGAGLQAPCEQGNAVACGIASTSIEAVAEGILVLK